VIEYVRRMLQPVSISEGTLATESIKRVGPGGTFLTEDQTLANCRSFWYSPLVDRRRYDGWLEAGSLTMWDRLNARVQDILTSHRPAPLDPSVAQGVDAFVLECELRSTRAAAAV
jgi:trimethylamine---corrinoid protein Co-methyltransferase